MLRQTLATGNRSVIRRQQRILSCHTLVLLFLTSLISFYLGLLLGTSLVPPCLDNVSAVKSKNHPDGSVRSLSSLMSSVTGIALSGKRFPSTMERFWAGAARIDRDEFLTTFDLGVPVDKTVKGNQEALILYSHPKSLSNVSRMDSIQQGPLPLMSVQDATINCDTLKIILTEPFRPRQCLALVGQWESYHVHKFMRLPPDNIRTGVNPNLPLRHVARTHSANKGRSQLIPRTNIVGSYDQSILVPYLQNLATTLDQLRPLVERIVADVRLSSTPEQQQQQQTPTIIAMVCNFGQSELIVNFICSARARGLDLSSVLIFTTDLETQSIVEALGVATFYDSVLFERMPEQAARRYGDGKFTGMMIAKVFCVHLLTQLNYNVLFQDADVVWYRHPLDYFANITDQMDFDMYFQDDGAHSVRYAPYSPNTGFYYVRAVDRTRYFFHCLVKLADTIQQSGSHQSALTSLLNEHVSYRGLRVKIFSRDTMEFPGGYHYHRNRAYMKEWISERQNTNPTSKSQALIRPYIFHMSWTTNKENKRKFFQQLGDWYVSPKCTGKKRSQLPEPVMESCCAAQPIVSCHYRDKPSIIPCKKSPSIDKNGRSWW